MRAARALADARAGACSARLNRAACYLRLNNAYDALQDATLSVRHLSQRVAAIVSGYVPTSPAGITSMDERRAIEDALRAAYARAATASLALERRADAEDYLRKASMVAPERAPAGLAAALTRLVQQSGAPGVGVGAGQ